MDSPRQGRTMRSAAPSAKSHSPRRPTGASSSGSMTVIVSVSVMDNILPVVQFGLPGVFRTLLVFLIQAAFVKFRSSRSTSFGARYPRAE